MKVILCTLSLASLLLTVGCYTHRDYYHRGGYYDHNEYYTGAARGYPDDRAYPRDGDRSGPYRWDSYNRRWIPAHQWDLERYGR